jgi:alkylation response protein AidB-like acyl-CoA dehydrogenase
MNLDYTTEELAFRDEVREFVRGKLPQDIARKVLEHRRLHKDDILRWQKILYEKGWIAGPWPKEYGGLAWTPIQMHLFDEETAALGAPRLVPFGLNMVAPVIMQYGSPWQKEYYLPRILSSEHWWCQGYSEPGAGSDLASLKTKAVAEGNDYIVSGHKIWTTQAHFADWMFCLVRTDFAAKPQAGISFLLIDMKSPGITVRPIVTLDEGHTVNEVFLDEVRVPQANLIGRAGQGWTYAKFLLGHERILIAGVSRSKQRLRQLKDIARAELSDGRPLIEDEGFRHKLASVEIELMALEYTNLRVLADEAAGKGPGPEASLLKIKGSEIQQNLSELACEALGNYALAFDHLAPGSNLPPVGPEHGQGVVANYFYGRAATIYGGSNEIQRNVVAKMVLGL